MSACDSLRVDTFLTTSHVEKNFSESLIASSSNVFPVHGGVEGKRAPVPIHHAGLLGGHRRGDHDEGRRREPPADDPMHERAEDKAVTAVPAPLKLLDQLGALLRESNGDAVEIAHELAQHPFGQSHDAAISSLLRHINEYDFDVALDVLGQLQQQSTVSNDG